MRSAEVVSLVPPGPGWRELAPGEPAPPETLPFTDGRTGKRYVLESQIPPKMSTILDYALSIAATGVPVFPCDANKRPVIATGFKAASTDPAIILSAFATPLAVLIGVPTGRPSSRIVIDVDIRPNHSGMAWLKDNSDALPQTRTNKTRSGGLHLVFKEPADIEIRNSAGRIAPGVDVRGEGGYVIVPPSPGYAVADPIEPAEMPLWLIRACLKPTPDEPQPEQPKSVPRHDGGSGYGLAALAGECDAIRSAPFGKQEDTLNSAGLKIGGLVAGGELQEGIALADLLSAGRAMSSEPGRESWRPSEIEAKIRRAFTDGQAKPRKAPPSSNGKAGHSSASASASASASSFAASASIQDDPAPDIPSIQVISGLRHKAADLGLRALAVAKIAFYQRDRMLVRTSLSKAKTSDGKVVEIPGIVPVTVPILSRALGSVARWVKLKADGEPVRIDPPKELVEQIAAMSGDWPFAPITGVIATPTMRPDGTILSNAGYDEMTGLVLLAPPSMPSIPDYPTRQDAQDALKILLGLLSEFPFADPASRSVALSMIITTVLRGALLPAVPMHVATAPQPGTGKSYLSDIAAAISTGERCAVIAVAPNADETEKRLQGAALSGQQIIALDNCSEVLFGDFLNQVTERPLLQLRPLGTSNTVRIANTFTVFANGNNLMAPADLVRRTLVSRLDANLENPEERVFASNPVKMILADRGMYVAACLIIGRAYVVAGSPNRCTTLASFDRWSDLVRSSLVWLDQTDPCSSMEVARLEDPVRLSRAALFKAWADEIGLNPGGLVTADLISEAEITDGHGIVHPRLREACLAVAAERTGTTISSRRLGKWLTSNNNNRVGDLKLTTNRSDAARPRWVLSRC